MNDMSSVIIPKSDQLNADSLLSGPMTITITAVDIRPGTEQPVAISFEGDNGCPWKPCKSMSRVLVSAWGPDAKAYIGRSATLYRDPSVKWGGMEVGGIRVSHLSHIDRDMVMALTATKGKRAPYTVRVLQSAPTAKTESPRAKAEAWLDSYEQSVRDAGSREELDRIHAKAANAIAKLKTGHPDLYERAMLTHPGTATGTPPAEATTTEDSAALSSATQEGPTDQQRGEAPTLDDALAAVKRAETVIDVNSVVSGYTGQLSDEDEATLQAAAMDRVAELRARK